MNNLYQTWVTGGSGYAVLQNELIVYNRIFNKDKMSAVKNYFRFVAVEDGTFSFYENNIDYSLDNGSTWTTLTANSSTPTISSGSKVMWRATDPTISSTGIGGFNSTGKFSVEGNIMSLLFGDDFEDKTDLTGKDFVFSTLFNSCTTLIDANNLILPATILANRCYRYMFKGCTSLVNAPELPATILGEGCYTGMFQNCTSLTTAPKLPATNLADDCYLAMFANCTNLIEAPELPATTLAIRCYYNMFSGCTLTAAPELPATTLAEYCYEDMFLNCKSLTTAPALPAATLASYCYECMFYGCESLVNAPELPATTLARECYRYMFKNCTSLTTAPVLPAATLASYCYEYMFYGCSKLNNITMLATNIIEYGCLNEWVDGVSTTGTFVKHPNMTTLPTGTGGIPTGWTVVDYAA